MKVLYFDCFSGVSGNMLLGALIGLGFSEAALRHTISALGLDPNILHIDKTKKSGIEATLVLVDNPPDQPERHLHHIHDRIDASPLPEPVKTGAKATFSRLAEAEAKVHGTTPESIHFHEVGAVDAMVDIVGVWAGIHALGVERVICSPLPLGSGTVECAHGTLPVPVPATVALLSGVPTYSAGRKGEHVTPTGAALVTSLAHTFSEQPQWTVEKSAYGSGTRTFESGPPNLLRAMFGELEPATERPDELVIETNIDDMNPEFYGPLTDKLFAAGALDVTLTPTMMKKGRPGTLVSIIGGRSTLDAIAEVLFTESTTIGLRYYSVSRIVCRRTVETVETVFGPIRVKISHHKGRIVGAKPEFDDCRAAAEKHGVSLQRVHREAIALFERNLP